MTINIGIVADARRENMGTDLAARVQADHISVDPGTLGCLGNHLAVWRRHLETPATWHVVLEDDAEPVDGFRAQLSAALEKAPSKIVSLYLGSGYIDDPRIRRMVVSARRSNVSWILTRGRVLHAVALAVHRELLPSMVEHLGRNKIHPVDQSLSRWARLRAQTIAYSVPSLVDHTDVRSLVLRYRRAPRKAFTVGSRQEWDNRSVFMV